MPCVSTSDPGVGSICDVAFAPQPLAPVPNDTWFNGKRVVIEITQFEVSDGGSDGVVSTTPNTLFMKQGDLHSMRRRKVLGLALGLGAPTNTVLMRQGIFIP